MGGLLGFGGGSRKNTRANRVRKLRAKVAKLEKRKALAAEEAKLKARLKALSK